MDDDAPLSALAKPKAKTSDDDLPLAALNSVANKSLAEKKSKGKGKGNSAGAKPVGASVKPPAGAGKGPGKGTKKKRESSSSSSYSSSDSSSSSGPDKKKARRKKALGPKPGAANDDNQPEAGAAFKKKQRSATDEVVAELLCRWWYVLPDWPPNDEEFYKGELAKRNYRKVRIEEWEWVPEEDQGRKKVYELSQFRGVFRNSAGDLVDCRPQETCPCWANLSKKDIGDLYDLLVKAYEGQLKELENSVYDETKHEAEVKRLLNKARQKASEAKQLGNKRR